LESNDELSDEQNGFRPSRSCQDHIFALSSIIEKQFHDNKDHSLALLTSKSRRAEGGSTVRRAESGRRAECDSTS